VLKFFKRAWLGAGYIEGYGHHPGTGVLLVMILCTGLAGAKKGNLSGFFGGIVIGAIAFLPFYIMGCVDRAKSYEEDVERTFQRLQKEY
jgi:hypothetical protein